MREAVVIAGPDGIAGWFHRTTKRRWNSATTHRETLHTSSQPKGSHPTSMNSYRIPASVRVSQVRRRVVERHHSMEEVALKTEEVYGRLLRSRRKT